MWELGENKDCSIISTVCKKLYLAVWEEYLLENMTKRPGDVLNCFVAASTPDEKSFEMFR